MATINYYFGLLLAVVVISPSLLFAQPAKNLHELPNELTVPAVTNDPPAAGKRVWQRCKGYEEWEIGHALFLPDDWTPTKKFPVIFEFPGNGGFRNELGDRSDGRVQDCELGYGLSGGKKFIWVSLPMLDPATKAHATTWWGDPDETALYCRRAVAEVCEQFGGAPQRLILTGFSRGAIACNFIGLHDDKIAKLWRAFMPHSHYDGVRRWNYAGSDRDSAQRRLSRIAGRPQFITHEQSTQAVEVYLESVGAAKNCEFLAIPFPNHSSSWVLKDIPQRTKARQWLHEVVR